MNLDALWARITAKIRNTDDHGHTETTLRDTSYPTDIWAELAIRITRATTEDGARPYRARPIADVRGGDWVGVRVWWGGR